MINFSHLSAWVHGKAVYRTLTYRDQILDDAVLTFWQAPNSYTGEDTVEISCHGNPHIVENILRACLELGARSARPGEFTQRAYLNDKLSLTPGGGPARPSLCTDGTCARQCPGQ